ncbi:MAG: AraD1 family protein [Balneolaceae bacterium]|nr:AraD1 family protein [Balneolaceae bacterium]
MKIVQFTDQNARRRVGISEGDRITCLTEVSTTYDLFRRARNRNATIEETADALRGKKTLDYAELAAHQRLLPPLDHPDPYHTWITGTGLTHLGSASSRDEMHKKLNAGDEEELTDTMKMFRMGLENGTMSGGKPASQPEWFFKGNGLMATSPEKPLTLPSFSMDGGEESEIAGLYIIDDEGTPQRLGFALANEFSDHKMEKINYLYLAHSKLRPCSYGPELRTGPLPADISGRSRIYRDGNIVWEKQFLTGEENMTHNIANLEYHHFKYDIFRQPRDVHIHMFGTSVLSFADGIEPVDGDLFEIKADFFTHPLRNRLKTT